MKVVHYLLCICLFFTAKGFSQKKWNDITSRTINLPGSFNRDLLQVARDDEGFIWLSTNEGVWRFDGSDMRLLDHKKLKLAQSTPSYSISCYDHFLLLCLNNGELHVYDKTTDSCSIYQMSAWLANVNRMPGRGLFFFSTNGQAWTFTKKNLLKKVLDLGHYRGWRKGMEISKGILDSDGSMYIFVKGSIGRVMKDSISWSSEFTVDNILVGQSDLIVNTTAFTSKYIAVQYFAGELAVYDKQTLALVYSCRQQLFAACISVHDELVAIPHDDAAVKSFAEPPFFHVQPGIFREPSKIFSLIEDNDKNLLIGSTTGLVQLTVSNANERKYYDQQKLVAFFSDKSVRSIHRLGEQLYVGTYSGLFVCTPDTIKPVPNGWAYTIQDAGTQKLLLGTEGGSGFSLLDCQDNTIGVFPKFDPRSDIYTTAMFRDQDSWITGDYVALHRLWEKNGNWHIQTLLLDSSEGSFRQISRIRNQIYIAGRKGLFTLDEKNQLHKVYPETGSLLVYCMQEVPDGIWLGTHGNGLVKINDKGKVVHQLGFNEGLASSFVYSIALMHNLLVAGTGAGASVFDIAGGAPHPLAISQDEKQNGLSSEECNHSAMYYDSAAGKVILGGVKGLIFVDSRDYGLQSKNKNEQLILSYIKTGGHETYSAPPNLFAYSADNIRVHPGEVNLVLKFAAPHSLAQEEGLFRIKELDEKWQRIKISQEVNFYALPPGTYTLQARLPFSLDEKSWFSKTLIVEPAFYQTIWFKGLLVLLFLFVVYLFWRAKVRKLLREQQLRTTIASDLHDDIGSTLNSISVYTEIARQQIQGDTEKTQVLLDKMGMASRNMIDKMGDIVWAINPKNDDFEQVLKRMQFFAGELLSSRNIILQFHANEKIKKLTFRMQERKNIYLVYKEAINNIYKYASASTVSVNIDRKGNSLEMDITDDGKGFDTTEKAGSGNGLTNMKTRAREIGGYFHIESHHEAGTRVHFSLPLHGISFRTTEKGSQRLIK